MFWRTALAFLVKARVEIVSARQRKDGLRQMMRWVKELLPKQSFKMCVSLESRKGIC